MRSILLVKTSSLGDVVHNLPVVSDLRRHWPGVAIDWVVEESFAGIPALHPGVRRVIPVAIRRWRRGLTRAETWRQISAFRLALRETYYDAVIDTQGLVKSAIVTRMARGWRCGFDRLVAREPLAALAYHARFVIPKTAHAVERNRWLAAAACDYDLSALPLDYGLSALRRDEVRRDAAVLLTATSRADKQWDENDWVKLGRALAERGLACVLPAGSAAEREQAGRIASAIPGASVLPPSGIADLARLMGEARVVVGVDTGLTHLAAAVGTPVVALYTATDPRLTGVFATRNAHNLGEAGRAPSVEEVLAAVHSYVARVARPLGGAGSQTA